MAFYIYRHQLIQYIYTPSADKQNIYTVLADIINKKGRPCERQPFCENLIRKYISE